MSYEEGCLGLQVLVAAFPGLQVAKLSDEWRRWRAVRWNTPWTLYTVLGGPDNVHTHCGVFTSPFIGSSLALLLSQHFRQSWLMKDVILAVRPTVFVHRADVIAVGSSGPWRNLTQVHKYLSTEASLFIVMVASLNEGYPTIGVLSCLRSLKCSARGTQLNSFHSCMKILFLSTMMLSGWQELIGDYEIQCRWIFVTWFKRHWRRMYVHTLNPLSCSCLIDEYSVD